jgi:glycerol-3-phosphate dehydrogenase
MKYEWAETAEDILWRRTKKGLRVPEGTDVHLQSRINDHKSYLNPCFEIKGVRIKGVTH